MIILQGSWVNVIHTNEGSVFCLSALSDPSLKFQHIPRFSSFLMIPEERGIIWNNEKIRNSESLVGGCAFAHLSKTSSLTCKGAFLLVLQKLVNFTVTVIRYLTLLHPSSRTVTMIRTMIRRDLVRLLFVVLLLKNTSTITRGFKF